MFEPMVSQILVHGRALEIAQISGDAQKSPLVFLHEGLGSVAMWRDFPARLCAATGRAGLVYSRRGYGQSEAIADVRGAGRLQADYMQREAWECLPELIRLLNIQRPILFGHSDGGTIALLHAARFKCEACIVMAPHVFVEELSLQSIRAAKTAFESGDLRQKLAKFHADVDSAFWQWNDVWLSDAFRSFNIVAECAQITCPLLAIQGQDDPYGTMAQIEAILPQNLNQNNQNRRQNMRDKLLKLEHCGHSPHRDQAEQVIQSVQNFLAIDCLQNTSK